MTVLIEGSPEEVIHVKKLTKSYGSVQAVDVCACFECHVYTCVAYVYD